jgi:hypothetical protein
MRKSLSMARRGAHAGNGSHTIVVASPKTRCTLSAAGSRAISLAQKARWAKRARKVPRRFQPSLSALCQQRLFGRLRLIRRHAGKRGRRSRRRRPSFLLRSSHTHKGPLRQNPQPREDLGLFGSEQESVTPPDLMGVLILGNSGRCV